MDEIHCGVPLCSRHIVVQQLLLGTTHCVRGYLLDLSGKLESFPEAASAPVAECMSAEVVTRPLTANTQEVCRLATGTRSFFIECGSFVSFKLRLNISSLRVRHVPEKWCSVMLSDAYTAAGSTVHA